MHVILHVVAVVVVLQYSIALDFLVVFCFWKFPNMGGFILFKRERGLERERELKRASIKVTCPLNAFVGELK